MSNKAGLGVLYKSLGGALAVGALLVRASGPRCVWMSCASSWVGAVLALQPAGPF